MGSGSQSSSRRPSPFDARLVKKSSRRSAALRLTFASLRGQVVCVDEIRDDPGELANRLAPVQGLVVFDGCAGVGKTHLARDIARRLDGIDIDVDSFLDRNRGCFVVAIRFDDLRAEVLAALERSPHVFLSTVCARDVIARLGVPVVRYVYVEQRSTMGNPANLEILDAESGTPEALAERPDPEVLDAEVFDYHAAFKPRRSADIRYIRTAD